jgi:pyrimidine-nucleoside phosphorylase
MAALITNMDIPLGHAIGNVLEIKEAAAVLAGGGPDDLKEVCLALASVMLELSLGIDAEAACALAKNTLDSGKAYEKFCEWIGEQGGDASYARDTSKFGVSRFVYDVVAESDGYVCACNAESIGLAAMTLGAGRASKTGTIDYLAGIMLLKKPGDKVCRGEVLAVLHTDRENMIASAEKAVKGAFTFSDTAPEKGKMIYSVVR